MTVLVLRQRRHLVPVPPALPVVVLCTHDLHAVWNGQRIGLHVHPSGRQASLTPCTHNNKDGQ
jgi:hypothetical protein